MNKFIVFLLIFLPLSGHTTSAKTTAPVKNKKVVALESNELGILVPGNPSDPISKAMPDFDGSRKVPANEISKDPKSGARIIRTALYIAFKHDATVGQVNSVLKSIDGRIGSSSAGNGVVSVHIKDPGNLDKLNSLIALIEKNPAVEIVQRDSLFEPDFAID